MRTLSLATSAAWEFRDAAEERWRSAVVPGCVHRDLRRHRVIPDPFWGRNEDQLQWISERDWEYRTRFTLPPEMLDQAHVELVADGLDTVTRITVNGREVGRTDNMFADARFAVGRRLHAGTNELCIRFESATRYVRSHRLGHQPREINDPVGGGTRLRKQQCQFGWDWAPRLVTAGIWRDLRLEAWSTNRLRDVRVTQHHAHGKVRLHFAPELARLPRAAGRLELRATVSRNGVMVAQATFAAGEAGGLEIAQPELWWPRGQGAQPLYDVTVDLAHAGTPLDQWRRRIGLRTIRLERRRDRWGERFQFVVNGRPVFAKGASWIPAHTFVGGLTRADYEPLVRAAAAAHFNMLRVWGGGVYEHDAFYALCDELGLMVWQDFMFACTLYPGDAAFVRSVRKEAEHQVRRLRHHACLALWCGNNELELLNADALREPAPRAAYAAVFQRALPEAVATHDGETAYWRSSPSQSAAPGLRDPTRSGNAHYWDVWHLLKPVKSYEAQVFRFVAEFGMQSFPSLPVARTFCPPEGLNIFSPVMERHQKNPAGNKIVLEYVSRRYRFPKDYAALAYLSQLNQAHCLQVGVEHFRRHQPRCMGTLYWQFNDCWPVASWSSVEFGGRWKALHHVARRFYAPYLLSAHVPGDETFGIGNRMQTDVRLVHLHTVCDAPTARAGRIRWQLYGLEGHVHRDGHYRVELRPGRSVRQATLDLAGPLEQHGCENLLLRVALEIDGQCPSEETVFLCPPRMVELPRGRTSVGIVRRSGRTWDLQFTSTAFQHRFAFDFAGITPEVSDNWFELYPGRTKTVTAEFPRAMTAAEIRALLSYRSLVDSY